MVLHLMKRFMDVRRGTLINQSDHQAGGAIGETTWAKEKFRSLVIKKQT